VLEQAAKAGKGTVAMKVMAGGFRRLAPKPDPNYQKLKQDGRHAVRALKWSPR